tara:strand:- start:4150 stop:4860 length:711 start_codon:yes stop_codon:yes gene_type:complete
VNVKYDFSGLNKALAQKVQLSRTPVVDIVQDAAMKVLIGTGTGEGLVQLTRKATKERIKADMNVPVSGKIGSGSGRTITRPRLFWLALQWMKQNGRTFSKDTVREVMSVILKMRIKSRAYIAAGWLFCARELHEKSPYLQKKHKLTRLKARNIPTVDKNEGGTAANSFATPVRVNGYTASIVLTNTSRGGGTVGMEFVQQALNNATKDVLQYVDKKLAVKLVRQLFKGVNCKIISS